MNFTDPRKKWFDVPDSKSKDGDEDSAYYNVEARFADHRVLDAPASHQAGHSVYQLVPQVHMHVKKNIFGNRSIKNSTSVVFRFDKGRDMTVTTGQVMGPTGQMVPNREGRPGVSKWDVDRYVDLILRCHEAWLHYQTFRLAPVHPLEEEVVAAINRKLGKDKGVHLVVGRTGRVDKDGKPIYDMVEYSPLEDDEDDNFDPDADIDVTEDVVIAAPPPPAPVKGKPGRKPKVAA